MKKFLQGLLGSSSLSIYDVAGFHVVASTEISGEAEAERRRAEKGKAPALPALPQEEPAVEELVTLDEVSECMSSEAGLALSSDAYLAQQIAEYERCQQLHRERQAAAQQAHAGTQGGEQEQPAQQGQGKARRIAAALSMFAGAPTLEEAVEALMAPAATPPAAGPAASETAAPAPATPGGQGAGGHGLHPQLSGRSYASSASGVEMELASIGSSGSAGGSSGSVCTRGTHPSCAGGSTGWQEIDLAPSGSCGGRPVAVLDDQLGPGGSRSRAAAWLHSQAGPGGSWDE